MYLFNNVEELERFLKKVKTSKEAKAVAQSLEARLAPHDWIMKAYKRAHELCE